MRSRFPLILILAALVLASCAAPAVPTATPTRTARPTDLPAMPTTAATDAPQPTGAPTAEPSATAVANPTATAMPANLNPLTGLPVADPKVLERRPLAVKISNAPGENVRPQSGINSADVVFEHIAEYGVTRLTGVFLGNDANPVGSVRSCRILDKEILRMFQAALACSGLSNGNYATFKAMPEFAQGRILSPSYGDWQPMFYRLDIGGFAPHNEFTNTPALWSELDKRGINSRQNVRAWSFDARPAAGGQPADSLKVNYVSLDARAEWRYDAASGLYKRWEAGKVFADRTTGQQTTAANVLVVYAPHIATDIVEDDNGGAMSVEIQLWGDGNVLVVRDGQAYKARWHREDPQKLFSITTADGTPLALKPGNTWVQVVYGSAWDSTAGSSNAWTVDSTKGP